MQVVGGGLHADGADSRYTQFTYFSGTKAQILTLEKRMQELVCGTPRRCVCRVSRDLLLARYAVYWLYWYKRTNTDAEGAAR